MTKITCDRCGKKIQSYPWQQTKFPMLAIMCINKDETHSIDLCEECIVSFEKWIESGNVNMERVIQPDEAAERNS